MNRDARAAPSAALPAAPLTLDDLPRRPWTAPRLLYTILLWMVWGVSMVWHTQLVWLDRFGPLQMSVALQPTTHASAFTWVYWVSLALLVVIPVRLFVDNVRVNLLPLLIGATWALMGCFSGSENVQVLDQIGGEVAYTKQVVVRERVVVRFRKASYSKNMVDHPFLAGQLIGFPESWAQGMVGDTLCMDVLVGKSGALWALLPKTCAK